MSEEEQYIEMPPYRYDKSGQIVRDKDHIPLSIRTGEEIISHLFQDELIIGKNKKNQSVISKLVGIKPKGLEYFVFINGKEIEKNLHETPCDRQKIFADQSTILVVGDGDGRSGIGMAVKYPNCTFFDFDRALTQQLKPKDYQNENVSLSAMDWNNLSLPDKSIDRVLLPYSQLFHDTLSVDALYELQRVTRKGAIMRGNFNFDSPDYGLIYGMIISQMGWDCWMNYRNQILIAEKKEDIEFSKADIQNLKQDKLYHK